MVRFRLYRLFCSSHLQPPLFQPEAYRRQNGTVPLPYRLMRPLSAPTVHITRKGLSHLQEEWPVFSLVPLLFPIVYMPLIVFSSGLPSVFRLKSCLFVPLSSYHRENETVTLLPASTYVPAAGTWYVASPVPLGIKPNPAALSHSFTSLES